MNNEVAVPKRTWSSSDTIGDSLPDDTDTIHVKVTIKKWYHCVCSSGFLFLLLHTPPHVFRFLGPLRLWESPRLLVNFGQNGPKLGSR